MPIDYDDIEKHVRTKTTPGFTGAGIIPGLPMWNQYEFMKHVYEEPGRGFLTEVASAVDEIKENSAVARQAAKEFQEFKKIYIDNPAQLGQTHPYTWAWNTFKSKWDAASWKVWEGKASLDDLTEVINARGQKQQLGPIETGLLEAFALGWSEEVAEKLNFELAPEDQMKFTQKFVDFAAWMLPAEAFFGAGRMGASALSSVTIRNTIAKALRNRPQLARVMDPIIDSLHKGIGGSAGLAAMTAVSKDDEINMFAASALLMALHVTPGMYRAVRAGFFGDYPAAQFAWWAIQDGVAKGADLQKHVPALMDRMIARRRMITPAVKRNVYGEDRMVPWLQKVSHTFKTGRAVPRASWFEGPYSKMPETYRRLYNHWVHERGIQHQKFSEVMFNTMDKLPTMNMRLAWSRFMDKPFSNLERNTLSLTEKEYKLVQEHALHARRLLRTQHIESHELEMLGDKAFMDNYHSYLARLYGKFTPGHKMHDELLALEREAAEITRTGYSPAAVQTFKNKMDRFLKRKDVPLKVRIELGEIHDEFYRTWRSLRDVSDNILKRRLQNTVAMNPSWFVEHQPGKGQALFRKVKDMPGVYEPMTLAQGEKATRWVRLRGKEWGNLEGGYLRSDVHDSMLDLGKLKHWMTKWYGKWLTRWKLTRTVWRPATHARNVMTNFILNDLGGLPFYTPGGMRSYKNAASLLRKHSRGEFLTKTEREYIDDLIGGGVLGGGVVKYELAGAFNKLGADFDPFRYDDWVHKWVGRGKVRRLGQKMGELYEAEEVWAKTAKYLHNRSKGMTRSDAVDDAMKWTLNYRDVSPALDKIRMTAMPFATFTFKVFPRLIEAGLKHPVRFAKYPISLHYLQSYALDQVGVSDKEWDQLHRMLPDYVRAGFFLPLPWRDQHKRLQFLDLTYILPWGDIGEFQQNWVGRLIQNPVANLYSELRSGTDFAGRPLWYEYENNWVKGAKFFQHVAKQFLPTFFPGGTDYGRLTRLALEQQTPKSLTEAQAFAATFTPFKVLPRSEAQIAASYEGRVRLQTSEAKRNLKMDLGRIKGMTDREKRVRRYFEEWKRIRNLP